jgi:mannose-1-phosphate guanylyltransferase/mannose-6-phosphate isomerase
MIPLESVRPWGYFRQYTLNEPSTVKILHLNPRSSTSLQSHKKRQEFWKVVNGVCEAEKDGEKYIMVEGDELIIPANSIHRIKTNAMPCDILEVSFGIFDEEDITRYEDQYGRKVE